MLKSSGAGRPEFESLPDTECLTLAKGFVFLCLGFLICLLGITIAWPLRAA